MIRTRNARGARTDLITGLGGKDWLAGVDDMVRGSDLDLLVLSNEADTSRIDLLLRLYYTLAAVYNTLDESASHVISKHNNTLILLLLDTCSLKVARDHHGRLLKGTSESWRANYEPWLKTQLAEGIVHRKVPNWVRRFGWLPQNHAYTAEVVEQMTMYIDTSERVATRWCGCQFYNQRVMSHHHTVSARMRHTLSHFYSHITEVYDTMPTLDTNEESQQVVRVARTVAESEEAKAVVDGSEDFDSSDTNRVQLALAGGTVDANRKGKTATDATGTKSEGDINTDASATEQRREKTDSDMTEAVLAMYKGNGAGGIQLVDLNIRTEKQVVCVGANNPPVLEIVQPQALIEEHQAACLRP